MYVNPVKVTRGKDIYYVYTVLDGENVGLSGTGHTQGSARKNLAKNLGMGIEDFNAQVITPKMAMQPDMDHAEERRC